MQFQCYLQFLYIKDEINNEFLSSFFVDTKLGKLSYLKEFIWDAYYLSTLKCFLQLFIEFRESIHINFPLLNRFGLYFQQGINASFRRDYLNRNIDYAKVKIKNFFYLNYRKNNKIYSYIIKLNDIGRVYAEHIHDLKNKKLLSMNLLYFMSVNILAVEQIKPTKDMVSDEELYWLQSLIGCEFFEQSPSVECYFDSYCIQICIPWENVVSVNLNRYK